MEAINYIKEFCKNKFYKLTRLEFIERVTSLLDKEILTLSAASKVNYTRTLIYRNEDFELLLLKWPPGSSSDIHDHGLQECHVSLLQGELSSLIYILNDNKLQHIKTCSMSIDKIYSAAEDEIHSIHNFSDNSAYSLHLYSKPIKNCRVFDIKGGSEIKTTSYDKVL